MDGEDRRGRVWCGCIWGGEREGEVGGWRRKMEDRMGC